MPLYKESRAIRTHTASKRCHHLCLKNRGSCTWETDELIFYMAILHSLKRKRYACKRRTSLVRKWSLILLSRSFARAYSTALLSISLSPIPHLHISRKQSADIIILKNWFILMLIFRVFELIIFSPDALFLNNHN